MVSVPIENAVDSTTEDDEPNEKHFWIPFVELPLVIEVLSVFIEVHKI
jgi:hypothetical protein